MTDSNMRNELADAILTTREREQVETLEAVRQHGEEGVSDLVAGLMLRNAHDIEWALQQQLDYEKADHQRTKDKLADALAELDLVRHRVGWLLGWHDDPSR